MAEYLFDPGYGRHLVSLVFSLEDMYADINKFKNLGQKKFYFKQYYPGMIKLLKQNTAFYMGCLLWAVYLKSLPEGKITGNHCLGKEYDENSSLVELLFLMSFMRTLSKDTKYYLGQDYKYSEDDMAMLEVYKEFARMNEGFVKVEKNTDLKLPKEVKTPSKADLEKIKATINEAVSTGEFDALMDLRGLIL
ncbi:MAG: hypothetical protein K6E29_05855 [Cyanobacteria bacterium RUI128]|nr:hypothetical protein [Cyanobacteria bacterium RUI128]